MNYPMGSISSGTMKKEDLIPEFLYTLKEISPKHELVKRLMKKRWNRKDIDKYYDSEESDYDLEDLFDALNELAGPYFYFGAHPGDGSDYGFWLHEFFEDDFDGIKVSDLSEIKEDYTGEALVINDHGNMTLYDVNNGKYKEIWSVI